MGTLIHPVPAAGDVYHRVAQKYGSSLAANEVARRFRQAFRDSEQGDLSHPDDGARLATSEDCEHERWRGIVSAVLDDVHDVAGCFGELFQYFAQPASWRCFREVAAVLAALDEHGYGLAIASNFDRRLHSVCDGLPELRKIGIRIISSEVGCRKPGRRFFDALVAKAGCRADEILMVGDDPANDVEGARQAGLQAVLINRKSRPDPGEIASLAELITPLES
ncbi:MAG: HAD-IA family hydrolase [Planctomycetia bacterium]|nr:HAD-IA family hydrolase [Planctomycetia bacterium]